MQAVVHGTYYNINMSPWFGSCTLYSSVLLPSRQLASEALIHTKFNKFIAIVKLNLFSSVQHSSSRVHLLTPSDPSFILSSYVHKIFSVALATSPGYLLSGYMQKLRPNNNKKKIYPFGKEVAFCRLLLIAVVKFACAYGSSSERNHFTMSRPPARIESVWIHMHTIRTTTTVMASYIKF